MSLDTINLQFCWVGSSRYSGDFSREDCKISVVDIKLKESTQEIFAKIPSNLSEIEIHPLKFSRDNNEDSSSKKDKKFSTVNLPINLLKSIKISVRIFEKYENTNIKILDIDNSYSNEIRVKRHDLAVDIKESEINFKPFETYLIKIVNQDTLYAIFEEKVGEVANQKLSEECFEFSANKPTINHFANSSLLKGLMKKPVEKLGNEKPETNSTLQNQASMIADYNKTMAIADSIPPEDMNQFTISDLNKKLEIAQNNLKTSLEIVNTRNPVTFGNAFAQVQIIRREIKSIQEALNK